MNKVSSFTSEISSLKNQIEKNEHLLKNPESFEKFAKKLSEFNSLNDLNALRTGLKFLAKNFSVINALTENSITLLFVKIFFKENFKIDFFDSFSLFPTSIRENFIFSILNNGSSYQLRKLILDDNIMLYVGVSNSIHQQKNSLECAKKILSILMDKHFLLLKSILEEEEKGFFYKMLIAYKTFSPVFDLLFDNEILRESTFKLVLKIKKHIYDNTYYFNDLLIVLLKYLSVDAYKAFITDELATNFFLSRLFLDRKTCKVLLEDSTAKKEVIRSVIIERKLWKEFIYDIFNASNHTIFELIKAFPEIENYLSALDRIKLNQTVKHILKRSNCKNIQLETLTIDYNSNSGLKNLFDECISLSNKYEFQNVFSIHFLDFTFEQKQLAATSFISTLFPNHLLNREEYTNIKAAIVKHFDSYPDLINIAPVLLGKRSMTQYLARRSELSNPDILPFVSSMLDLGSVVTIEAVIDAIDMHNINMLKFLLMEMDLALLWKHSAKILQMLAHSEDLNLLDLFKTHVNLFVVLNQTPEKASLLKKMIELNQPIMIDWLFLNGLEITALDDAKMYFQQALLSNNLQIILTIWNQIKEMQGIDFDLFKELDLLSKDRLLTIALFSPLKILKDFIDQYFSKSHRIQKTFVEDVIPIIASNARFPLLSYPKNILKKDFFNLNDYLQHVKAFNKITSHFLKSIKKEICKWDWDNFLKASVRFRKKHDPQVTDQFCEIRSVKHVDFFTSIRILTSNRVEDIDSLGEPNDRYMHAWHQANRLFTKDQHVFCLGRSIQFCYPIDEQNYALMTELKTESYYDISGSSKMLWIHTKASEIEKCKIHINKLFKQVFNFKLSKDNRHELEMLIAENYWLAVSLCQMLRGSAHHAKLFLLAAYMHHGLPLPIPKIEYFFLDTIMLSLSLYDVKKNWRDFFEDEY